MALDPTVEILAIKLFEHDHPLGWYPHNAGGTRGWMWQDEETRDRYRRYARGDDPLPCRAEAPPASVETK